MPDYKLGRCKPREKFKRVGLFIGITLFLGWFIPILFLVFGGKWGTLDAHILGMAIMFTPMTSAILVQKFVYKEPLKKPLGISFKLNRWWLVAWLLPPFIAFATVGISSLIPGISYSQEMTGFFERFEGIIPSEQLERMRAQIAAFPIHIFWIALILGLLAGITVNAVAGFGEELGWRGFLLKEFENMGLWKLSAIIGFSEAYGMLQSFFRDTIIPNTRWKAFSL